MMLAKLATTDLLKIGVSWNEGYDIITFVHNAIIKILLCELNYIVDLKALRLVVNDLPLESKGSQLKSTC